MQLFFSMAFDARLDPVAIIYREASCLNTPQLSHKTHILHPATYVYLQFLRDSLTLCFAHTIAPFAVSFPSFCQMLCNTPSLRIMFIIPAYRTFSQSNLLGSRTVFQSILDAPNKPGSEQPVSKYLFLKIHSKRNFILLLLLLFYQYCFSYQRVHFKGWHLSTCSL